MNKRDFYYRNFVLILVAIAIFSAVLNFLIGDKLLLEPKSFYFALFVNLANSIIGLKILYKAMDTSPKKFYIYGLGSLTARLFLVIILVLIGLLAFKLNKISFIFALFFFYFLFLIIETIFIIKRNNYLKRFED